MVERVPEAEALAGSWMLRARPLAMRLYLLRRRIATVTVAVLAGLLFVHVMFGANGMIVYKQKRAEYESLHRQLLAEQEENERYAREIEALKKDDKAIEKEAREQLGYAKPGEYVYVAPAPPKPAPQANRTAKNKNTEICRSEFLTTTNVVPHSSEHTTSAASARMRCFAVTIFSSTAEFMLNRY